ncbi:MAG: hypothetical protein EOP09_06600 [Proteobacteria bacterium]|nr:MAG: hypothetical protein EOP09_06600 [Pseudomonadota bacterium]
MRRLLYLALGLILSPKLFAEERPLVWDEQSVGDDWDRAVRDFRRDHNFGFLLGQTRTQWKGRTDTALEIDEKTYATELTLQYSFHIPWSKGFGYSLGTSSSIQLDQGESEVSTHYRATLPGLELGLVWNANSAIRFNLGVVYGWERVDGLRVKDEPGTISITEESLSGKFSIDVFWKLTWAVRIEFEDTHFPTDAALGNDLEKNIVRLRVGLIKHLL